MNIANALMYVLAVGITLVFGVITGNVVLDLCRYWHAPAPVRLIAAIGAALIGLAVCGFLWMIVIRAPG